MNKSEVYLAVGLEAYEILAFSETLYAIGTKSNYSHVKVKRVS